MWSAILLCGLATLVNAQEIVFTEGFEDLDGWYLTQPSSVSITSDQMLRIYNDSGTTSLIRKSIDAPVNYTLNFEAKMNGVSAINNDTLVLRLRNSVTKLELKFRNKAVYALTSKDDGALTLVKLFDLDLQNHHYQVVVNDSTATVYLDGAISEAFSLIPDTTAPFIFLFNKGTLTDPSDVFVDNLVLTYEPEITVKNLGGGEPKYRNDMFTVFNLLPKSTVAKGEGVFSLDRTYEESDTQWTASGLDPKDVWRNTLNHDSENPQQDWEIRIGKGGQIYSFRTAAGELMPPQEHAGAEWVDEVFQVVTVNTKTNNRDPIAYPARSFVHQAGTYWKKSFAGETKELDPEFLNHSWYSPMLEEFHNEASNSYSSLVWGQYSHAPSIYESRQLIYSDTKDLGDGVIQHTHVITNRGTDTINWLNLPWGGVRASNLPIQLLSNIDGTYTEHNRYFGQVSDPSIESDMGIFDHDSTNGWFAWSGSNNIDANALSIVFGKGQLWDDANTDVYHRKPHFKWGVTKSATRDYNVGVNIVPVNIKPGESFYYQYFMVVGDLKHVAEKSNELSSHVNYAILNLDEADANQISYSQIQQSQNGLTQTVLAKAEVAFLNPEINLFTDPVTDSVPLFLMRKNQDGSHFISDNPYEIASITDYDNPYNIFLNEKWENLDGWTVASDADDVKLIEGVGLSLSDNNGVLGYLSRTDIDVPTLNRVSFDLNIEKFGANGSDAFALRILNKVTKLDIKFRNGNLYIVDQSGVSVTLVKSNIDSQVWHNYEWVTSYDTDLESYYAELIIDGEKLMIDGTTRKKFYLPADKTSKRVFLYYKGDASGQSVLIKNLSVADSKFHSLENKKQYKAYDGSTEYIGMLGYVMPKSHESSVVSYSDLASKLADTSYYPDSENIGLKAITPYFDNTLKCDLTGDSLIDKNDLLAIRKRLNSTAEEKDPADWNDDGTVNVLDMRGCVLTCTLPRCVIGSPDASVDMEAIANDKAAPEIYDIVERSNGITEMYLKGQPYQGKPTRIFALYSSPKVPLYTNNGDIPAVVLVHGGGGSAFEEWVTKWNDAGYAAISIAVEGQTDQRNADNSWKKHSYSGPTRDGVYGDSDKPITDQWMYHAVSATIKARKFLESQDDISKNDIGISGISWGGVITSTVIGFDPSFKFAIPIYGIGFLNTMDNQYGRSLVDNPVYKNIWEPGLRIEQFKNPTLWLTWRDDVHFALDAQAKTYGLLKSDVANSIKQGIKHGHVPGWSQPESYFFADKVINDNASWVENYELTLSENNTASATFKFNLATEEFDIKNVSVEFTSDQRHTGKAFWQEMPATLHVNTTGSITVEFNNMPEDVIHWFFNLTIDVNSENYEANELITVSSGLFTTNN
jgi:dienelactone hydrolase